MAMDDLSDDGVSPPEWQSGSEREPEDDKEIEGNEPDEIPPSDPDSYVGLKEAENNGQWLQCIGKSVEKLPSYDGLRKAIQQVNTSRCHARCMSLRTLRSGFK